MAEKTSEEKNRNVVGLKWKLLFFLLVILVQAALLIKWPLFLFRHFFPRAIPHFCQEFNDTVSSLDQKYIFSIALYSILFIVRFIEALIIEFQIYKFFFREKKKDSVSDFIQSFSAKIRSRKILLIAVIVISIYLTIHSVVVALLGLTLELHDSQITGCSSYPYEVYVIYWILDIIRYGYDVAVRVFMIIATLAILHIWQHCHGDLVCNSDVLSPSSNLDSYKDILKDREAVSTDHQLRSKEYIMKGRVVEDIEDIFETWFVIPWILFFIGSSLSADHILQAWSEESSSEATYEFSEIVFLVYNLNQLSLLLIPYVCSLVINRGHKKYLSQLRKRQLNRFNKSDSQFAFASMQKIEKDIHFDFVPRIFGTSIKIYIDEPFFVIFLFIGVFFTICEALI